MFKVSSVKVQYMHIMWRVHEIDTVYDVRQT